MTDSTSDLTGGEIKRQVDIFLKNRIGKKNPKHKRLLNIFIKTRNNRDEKHNWKNLRMIKEFKRSE